MPLLRRFQGQDSLFLSNFAAMKKTKDLALVIMFTLLVLCQSCGDGSVADRYDHRLTAADSLLHMNNPDSALQVLSAIDGTVLHSASERAYHALLLTQAQYRCYVAINSDSTINVALNYYQRGRGEQEKLTRAYIYKGAVTEVLGAPEDAMRYYKQFGITVTGNLPSSSLWRAQSPSH